MRIIAKIIAPAVPVIGEEPNDRLCGAWASLLSNPEPLPAIVERMSDARRNGASGIEIDAIINSAPESDLAIKKKVALEALYTMFETELQQAIRGSLKSKSQQLPNANKYYGWELDVGEAAVGLFKKLWKVHKRYATGMDLREALRFLTSHVQRDKELIVTLVCGIGT